jgi:hypothetical protein
MITNITTMPVYQIYFADNLSSEMQDAARELDLFTKEGQPDVKEYIRRAVGRQLSERKRPAAKAHKA